ncbi:MAG: hypothetical protein COA97_02165 [Flavobacteriales bacterium]|nr:MAG: hypothetical protein COA97_02165 [Flavobacteriales bacterium]
MKISLIPAKNWGENLRRYYSAYEWNGIRYDTEAEADYKCTICGSDERELHCHEIWKYDDDNCIQKLVGLQMVCEYCHHAIHWGALQEIDNTGKLIEKVKQHFLRINNCTEKEFVKHKKEAFILFWKRTDKNYEVDFGDYEINNEQIEKAELKSKYNYFKSLLKRTGDYSILNYKTFPEFFDDKEFIKKYRSHILKLMVNYSLNNYGLHFKLTFSNQKNINPQKMLFYFVSRIFSTNISC